VAVGVIVAAAIPEATRSPAEFAASESTATDPVTRPTRSLATVSTALDASDVRVAARLRRA
jgi:hypothetical protein